MADRGPRGTSDWAEYSLEVEVPEDATNISFGMLMPGQGQAWFDSLVIELDGEAFEDPARFDLDFESGIGSFSAFVPGYRIQTDGAVAHTSSSSLRIESLAADPSAMDIDVAAKGALEILEELESSRDALLLERGASEVDLGHLQRPHRRTVHALPKPERPPGA